VPQIRNSIGVLGSLTLAAGLFGAGVHILLGDYLLFFSDPLSLGVYLSAIALLLLPVLLVFSLPVQLAPRRWRQWLRRTLALGLAALVAAIFLMLALSFVASWLDITLLKRLTRQPFILFAICAVPAVGAIVASRNRKEIAGRIEQFGLALLAVAAAGLVATQVFQSERGAGPGKHLVLMILDGMPSQHMHSYQPAAPNGPLDRLAAEGLLFTQARSSAVWTNAYFGTLYSGSTRTVEAPRDEKPAMVSLIARLQRGGVSARWHSYHRNGMPEGGAAHTNDYRGLRSYLLTANTAWIPRLLHLDYHLAVPNAGISQNLRGELGRALFDWINNENRKYDNRLTEQLVPLLREQRGYARDTFTLFHTGWNSTGGVAEEARAQLPRAQAIEGLEDIARNASETIRANDYLYEPDLEPYAEQNRRNAGLGMIDLGVHLTDFLTALAADALLRDTVVIVTSDHGSMYEKGRFWYGFHPNEEVVRVPLLLFNIDRKGRDNRLVGTPDISASVLGFFGLPNGDSPGRSIFEVGPGPDSTTTLTLRSDINNEWFLVISEPGRKYRINLHPEGRGETVTLRVDGYDETPAAETIGPPEGKADQVAAALRDYSIGIENIHTALRP
jgi:hypothetical protein